MGSTRLPGKILKLLEGRTLLERVLTRVRRAPGLDDVVVVTSKELADDSVAEFCRAHGSDCFRGSHLDVLDRYYQAARHYGVDVAVRMTADCPFLDPNLVQQNLALQSTRKADYVSLDLPPRTFPLGLDAEIMSFPALERAWKEAQEPAEREHVTPYFYAHPELFQICGLEYPRNLSEHRWTVDTAQDLEFARRVYRHFGRDDFSWLDVVELVDDTGLRSSGRPS